MLNYVLKTFTAQLYIWLDNIWSKINKYFCICKCWKAIFPSTTSPYSELFIKTLPLNPLRMNQIGEVSYSYTPYYDLIFWEFNNWKSIDLWSDGLLVQIVTRTWCQLKNNSIFYPIVSTESRPPSTHTIQINKIIIQK